MTNVAVNTGKVAPVPQRGIAVFGVYALYDRVGMTYMQPFYFQYDAQAVRKIQDDMADANSMLVKHPKDFSLYRLGTYDLNMGELCGLEKPVFICDVNSLVVKPEGVN